MTWTYDGAPGDSTAAERRDAVRLLIGDTDTNDQQLTDEEIAFTLSQVSDNIYRAAALCARSLSGKYSRRADTDVESVRIRYSSLSDKYLKLAWTLERDAKKYSSGGLGGVAAGGISESTMDTVRQDDDRVDPQFTLDKFHIS